ncbi:MULTISPECIES: cytochrome b/b6 domain-containing protein [Reinekea]|jgi:cytochrome b|uniref:Cytochrome B561 n=1 Tax=Reinekea forsetii TaxID=1336806 RepID=A0A2K8L076_9GAMM|nr:MULTISPECIES: cytochrome b/b6 domain-containing protein [Reinekea]ATX78364.1 cytochrome B561 [Reinekea forsetii]MDO7641040.1 cytochrome b/b6 domain-containing protein [Reinekea forsetii]MDO7645116.1 cytochrome b/b6 domain-containing protein [Reinekea forsetii]
MTVLPETEVLVWDLLVRVFHWSLVVFFGLSYLTGGELDWLHEWSGYAIVVLIGVRTVWGFVGSRHARFSDFVTRPAAIKGYLLALKAGNPKHYLGHNPAGGLMIICLLLGLAFMAFTGMLLAGFDGNGPLVESTLMAWEFLPIKDLHEIMASLLILAIGVHVAAVLLSSYLHGENLIRAMLNGKKQRRVP